jgi:hypothetical protein
VPKMSFLSKYSYNTLILLKQKAINKYNIKKKKNTKGEEEEKKGWLPIKKI